MKIRIPNKLIDWYEPIGDWLNTPLYRWRGYEFRRIDVAILLFGVVCVSYYGWTSGWQGALLGGLMYALMAMIALWIL